MLTDCCHLGTDTTAAPAAVFPSALASRADGGPNWRRFDYLAQGNPRQRSAHALLTSGLWGELAAQCQDLALVSTVAIGLDQPGSDLDILCQHRNPAAFAERLGRRGWRLRDKGRQIWLAEQTLAGPDGHSWPVELYITTDPVQTRHGWRHLSLMAALLERFGHDFYLAVLHLRQGAGLKGEAAICRLLDLPGDPYQALLTLEDRDLGRLFWPPAPFAHPSRAEDHSLP
ncbi:MAG: DUF4269 domain-containing protein [Aeromonas sp.]|uniref:DUF4269 domain-containing protein n=1 Tax=Aeromonas sp. TaxID=647 RepID=UPI003F3B81A3